jgi:hypothetical protein
MAVLYIVEIRVYHSLICVLQLFQTQKQLITKKWQKEATVVQVFHGTKGTDPKTIYGDVVETGFHTGHAANGAWGLIWHFIHLSLASFIKERLEISIVLS